MAEPALKYEDDELNPGQSHYKRQFSVIDGGGNSTPDRSDLRSIDNQEANPEQITDKSIGEQEANGSNTSQDSWKINIGSNKPSLLSTKKILSLLKGKGAIGIIGIIIIIAGFGCMTLMSPSLMLVHMKELLVIKYNNQYATMEVRANEVLATKTTGGIYCGNTASIRCRFSSMSEKQAARLKQAGIEVVADSTSTGKKIKPKFFIFQGEKISASQLRNALNTNTGFKTAYKTAFSSKFVGWADTTAKKVLARFNLSKKATNIGKEGATEAERLKAIQEEVKSSGENAKPRIKGHETDPNTGEVTQVGDKDPTTGKEYTVDEAAELNDKYANEAMAEAEANTNNGAKSSAKSTLSEFYAKKSLTYLSLAGKVQMACLIYTLIKAIAYTAKTVRAEQLQHYAMIFLNEADQQKTGDAKDGDASYLGKVLTTTTLNSEGKLKAATDSFGWQYTQFGTLGEMPTSANRFINGGGFSGELVTLNQEINKATFGIPDKTCNLLLSNFAVYGSIALTALALYLSKGKVASYLITQAAVITAFALASKFLPPILEDMIQGTMVDETLVGEDSGDALVAGSSSLMSQMAQAGANAPLTKPQAAEFETFSQSIAAKDQAEERLTSSPFDISKNSTFLGKIVDQLIPYASKFSSFSTILTSLSSFITRSFGLIMPRNAYATSAAAYDMCNDNRYQELGVATDPFCNVTYGIPQSSLEEADPIQVADALLNQPNPTKDITDETVSEQMDYTGKKSISGATIPLIADDGTPIGTYAEFVKNCINRTNPLIKSDDYKYTFEDPSGRTNTDVGEGIGGSECIFNDSKGIDVSAQSWDNCTTEPDKSDQISPAGLGYVLLSTWKTTKQVNRPGKDCDVTEVYTRHVYYIGNAYLYIHAMDKRIDEAMDGITSESGSGSMSTSDQYFSPIKEWDLIPRDYAHDGSDGVGIPPGECSDHGSQSGCPTNNGFIEHHNTFYYKGDGLDIGDPGNTVYAVHSGKITLIEGKQTCLERIGLSSDNMSSLYAHIKVKDNLKVGDPISAGDEIGVVINGPGGEYGCTSGYDHVHFELIDNGNYVKAGDMPNYFK